MNKCEVRHKFITDFKKFALESYISDFKTLPLTTIYSFDDTDDQLDMLDKFILPAIDKHPPLE